MKTVDFVFRQETGEFRAGVHLYTPGRVGFKVAMGDCMVQDLAKRLQPVVGRTRRTLAVVIEPSVNRGSGNAVEGQRAEGREKLGFQAGSNRLLMCREK